MTHRQTVRDVMTPDPIVLDLSATVRDAARAMRARDIGDVLVANEGRLWGILTDRDIVVRAVAEFPEAPGACKLADDLHDRRRVSRSRRRRDGRDPTDGEERGAADPGRRGGPRDRRRDARRSRGRARPRLGARAGSARRRRCAERAARPQSRIMTVSPPFSSTRQRGAESSSRGKSRSYSSHGALRVPRVAPDLDLADDEAERARSPARALVEALGDDDGADQVQREVADVVQPAASLLVRLLGGGVEQRLGGSQARDAAGGGGDLDLRSPRSMPSAARAG